jgi:uncharacterized protein (TIGR02284 family)
MAVRDRQNPQWDQQQDWREGERDWRERDQSWRREGQQQGWQGRRESQWTPETGYRSRGAYDINEHERNDQAQRDYVFGEQQGGFARHEPGSARWPTGYGRESFDEYRGSGHSGYAGYSSPERQGSAWQTGSGYGGYGSQERYGSERQSGSGYGPQRRTWRRGPKGYKRSDERIREDVCERLMMSDVDTSEVSVDVRDGTVILEGYVTERRMKYAIEDIAEQALGVADVENNVRVSRQTALTSWTGRDESAEADGLNRCLRSELSAIETYRQALDRDRKEFGAQREFERLSKILREHEDAASRLRQCVRTAGGEPSNDSGAWGTWSKIVMGAAKLFGDRSALKALKEGEESGLADYQRCLRDSNVSAQTRDVISDLMARQQRHIRELDDLIDAVDRK